MWRGYFAVFRQKKKKNIKTEDLKRCVRAKRPANLTQLYQFSQKELLAIPAPRKKQTINWNLSGCLLHLIILKLGFIVQHTNYREEKRKSYFHHNWMWVWELRIKYTGNSKGSPLYCWIKSLFGSKSSTYKTPSLRQKPRPYPPLFLTHLSDLTHMLQF